MHNFDRNGNFSHALLERLIHYFYFVSERLEAGSGETVTSTQIARMVHMDDTLVRKDLAAIGVRGHPRVGFRSAEVYEAIRKVLGFDQPFRGVIIGIGHLGSAMASYYGFSRYGLEIAGLFDNDPVKIGLTSGDLVILPLDRLELVTRERDVRVAILTVPPDAAQEVAERAIAAGIKTLWNFASANLIIPEDVFVRHEHISVGLAELSYHLKRDSKKQN